MGTFFISLWNTLTSDFDWREVFRIYFQEILIGILVFLSMNLDVWQFLSRFISKEFIGIGSAVQSFFYGLFLRNVGILIGILVFLRLIVEAKKIFFSISMSIFNLP